MVVSDTSSSNASNKKEETISLEGIADRSSLLLALARNRPQCLAIVFSRWWAVVLQQMIDDAVIARNSYSANIIWIVNVVRTIGIRTKAWWHS